MNSRILNHLDMIGARIALANLPQYKLIWFGQDPADFETDLAVLTTNYAATNALASQISGDSTGVTFAPDEGTWLLRGTIAADGAIDAERITAAASKQAYETRFTGKLNGSTITGTYKTPKCTYEVNLTEK